MSEPTDDLTLNERLTEIAAALALRGQIQASIAVHKCVRIANDMEQEAQRNQEIRMRLFELIKAYDSATASHRMPEVASLPAPERFDFLGKDWVINDRLNDLLLAGRRLIKDGS